MKIGLFGGSFDPIHNGHLMLAEQARIQLQLDTIIFIPTYVSPYIYKNNNVSFAHRYRMIDKALKHNNYMRVSNIEYQTNPSYSINTIRKFKKIYNEDELYLIIGPDGIKTFSSWKDHEKIKKLVNVIFTNIDFYCPIVEIRSTLIRKLIKEKKPIRYLVPDTVNKYIREHKLYK